MKLITLITIFIFSLSENNKIIGLWQSLDAEKAKYLDFKTGGNLFEIDKEETKKKPYNVDDKSINIRQDNGSFSELTYYFLGDTLIIQKVDKGKIIKEKYIKRNISL